MFYLPHKINFYKYEISKNEYGQPVKDLIETKNLKGLFNIRKTIIKDLEVGLVETKKFELILKKKDVDKLDIKTGIDEFEIFHKFYIVESKEPIILPFTNKIEYIKLTLKEKINTEE